MNHQRVLRGSLAIPMRHHLTTVLLARVGRPGFRVAVSRSVNTALVLAAAEGHAPCVASLLKAGADASLENNVSDGAEGRGGEAGRGGGRGLRRRRRLSAPPSLPSSSPGAAASTLQLHPSHPSSSQDGKTALDLARRFEQTEVIKLLENPLHITAQIDRAAPCRTAPHPPHRPRAAAAAAAAFSAAAFSIRRNPRVKTDPQSSEDPQPLPHEWALSLLVFPN